MESKGESKEINIKNCTCYYFDDIIKIEDFDLDNILIDGKSCKNILLYNISYKSSIDSKPLHIRFDKIDGFIRAYDGTRHLVLFGGKKNDFIFSRIRYTARVKSCIRYVVSHDYAKIKVDSDHSFSWRKHRLFIL